MSQFELLMPNLGESVEEATITKWFVKEGDSIVEDDALLEIATDKVDSEIPSPVAGKIIKILYQENEKIAVGKVIALINTGGDAEPPSTPEKEPAKVDEPKTPISKPQEAVNTSGSGKFYSPLVKSISKQEGISIQELDAIEGTGQNGRVKKDDVLNYLSTKSSEPKSVEPKASGSSCSITGSIGTCCQPRVQTICINFGRR